MIEIKLQGNVPSKKNSRIRTRSGSYIPNKLFTQWQEEALWQVRAQCKQRFLKPVRVDVIIYFATMARADLDNRLTSILDMLVEGLVLPDDKWQNVPEISAKAEYRKGDPGALIHIAELADVIK